LLVSESGCRYLGEGGFPSAMFAEADYQNHKVTLLPGDTVLFATDGLHEMRNQREEDLSWGKLGEIWSACLGKSADEALDFLFAEVRAFSGEQGDHDDITALVLRVPGGKSGLPSGELIRRAGSILKPGHRESKGTDSGVKDRDVKNDEACYAEMPRGSGTWPRLFRGFGELF
jgi:serine/threonine protein phosphatase PrpC